MLAGAPDVTPTGDPLYPYLVAALGSITNSFARTSPVTPNGSAPGWSSPKTIHWGHTAHIRAGCTPRLSAINITVRGVQNPITNTDIFLTLLRRRRPVWSNPVWSTTTVAPGWRAPARTKTSRWRRSVHRPHTVPARDRGRSGDRYRGPVLARRPRRRGQCATSRPTSPPASTAVRPSAPRPTPTPQDRGQRHHRPDRSPRPSVRQPVGRRMRRPTVPFGYGNQMGLAVFRRQGLSDLGRRFQRPQFSGCLRRRVPLDSYHNPATGANEAFPLNIWYQPMAMANIPGPRIISSTMGPVRLTTPSPGRRSTSPIHTS